MLPGPPADDPRRGEPGGSGATAPRGLADSHDPGASSEEVLALAPEDEDEDEPALRIHGEIRGQGTPRILRSLLKSGESGVAAFWNGGSTKRISLARGRIVHVTSTDPDERLGEVLLVSGRITARQYVEASKLIRPGKRLGAILVEIGVLDTDQLIPAISEQARSILFELFRWTTGQYEMTLGEVDASEFVPLHLPPDQLVAEGMRRITSWSAVYAGITSLETVFARATGPETWQMGIELTREEQTVLDRVNGRLSVEEICDTSFLSSFDTCRTVWMLSVLGLIERAGRDEVAVAQAVQAEAADRVEVLQIVDRFNRLFERIHEYLDSRPGPGADAFFDDALREIAPSFGRLFENISLQKSGRIEGDTICENLKDESVENRKMQVANGLSELVYATQYLIRQNYGAQDEAVVSGMIRGSF
jgi:hypothetical protein